MSSFRANSKKAKGSIEITDKSLIQSKGSTSRQVEDRQGNGIGDIFSSVANLVSNHGSKIMTGIDTAGKAGVAVKNIFDAKKSYSEMTKAAEELDFIKKKKREKEAKKRMEEDQQTTNQSNKVIEEMVKKALLQQGQPQSISLRQGNGLKKF